MNVEGYNVFRSYNSLNQCDRLVVYIDNSLSVSCTLLPLGGVVTALFLTFDWTVVFNTAVTDHYAISLNIEANCSKLKSVGDPTFFVKTDWSKIQRLGSSNFM